MRCILISVSLPQARLLCSSMFNKIYMKHDGIMGWCSLIKCIQAFLVLQ